MAKDRSEQSRFTSRYGGGFVSDSQYLTECLCCLIARQQKKELRDRFWIHPPWDKVFRTQIPAAAALLKEYPVGVILATLRDRRCWKITSLRARWLLDPVLKEKAAEQTLRDSAPAVIMEKTETIQRPRPSRCSHKSLLTILRESENGRRPN